MNPALAGVALAVTAGAVIAASAREARAALVGLVVALALGPFLSDPLPGAAVLGARVVTGILVVVLIRAASPGGDGSLGSRFGWPAMTAIAGAIAIAGIAIARGLAQIEPTGPATPPAGTIIEALTPSALALGAGFATLIVGLGPSLLADGALRAGIGLLLVVQGLVLARIGVGGAPGDLEQLGFDGVILTLGAAVAMLIILEGRDERGGRSVGPGALARGQAAEASPDSERLPDQAPTDHR